jgi:hypothetical protein
MASCRATRRSVALRSVVALVRSERATARSQPQHYARATIARLVEMANRVSDTRDRTTLLRVVNG